MWVSYSHVFLHASHHLSTSSTTTSRDIWNGEKCSRIRPSGSYRLLINMSRLNPQPSTLQHNRVRAGRWFMSCAAGSRRNWIVYRRISPFHSRGRLPHQQGLDIIYVGGYEERKNIRHRQIWPARCVNLARRWLRHHRIQVYNSIEYTYRGGIYPVNASRVLVQPQLVESTEGMRS